MHDPLISAWFKVRVAADLAIATERLHKLEQVLRLAVEQEDDYARINHLAHPHWFEQARRLLAAVPGARHG
jgi:hypothetical protein